MAILEKINKLTLTVKDIFKVTVKDIFKVTCTRIIQHIFSKNEWIYSLITKKQQFQQNTIIWPWGSRSFQSQGHIKFELRQDLIVIHILYKNHQDWRRNERNRVATRWHIDFFDIQGHITLDILDWLSP